MKGTICNFCQRGGCNPIERVVYLRNGHSLCLKCFMAIKCMQTQNMMSQSASSVEVQATLSTTSSETQTCIPDAKDEIYNNQKDDKSVETQTVKIKSKSRAVQCNTGDDFVIKKVDVAIQNDMDIINKNVLLKELKRAVELNNKIDYEEMRNMEIKIKKLTILVRFLRACCLENVKKNKVIELSRRNLKECEIIIEELKENSRLSQIERKNMIDTIKELKEKKMSLESKINNLTGVRRYVSNMESNHVSSNFVWYTMEKNDKKVNLGIKGYQRISIDRLSEFRLRTFMDKNDLIFVKHPKNIVQFYKRDGFFCKSMEMFENPEKPREMLSVLKQCNCNPMVVSFLQDELKHIDFKINNGVAAYITFQYVMFRKILCKVYSCEKIAENISVSWGDMTQVCIPSVVCDATIFNINDDEIEFLTNKELWNVPPMVYSEYESSCYVENQLKNINDMFPGIEALEEIVVVESLPTGRVNSCANLRAFMSSKMNGV